MAPKLPNHLASLLRHQPEAPAASSATEFGRAGKAARKKAARVKRRSKAKEERAADRAEREKKRLQETQVAETQEEPVDPPKSKVKTKKKKLVVKKRAPAAGGEDGKASTSKSSVDSEAARDQALLRDLEKKLGIAGDSKRRRKEEKQIFEDLFEGEDLGIEELPSSDEEADDLSKSNRSSLEALNNEDMVGLLDSILGGETTSKGKTKAKVKKKSKA